VGKKSLRWGTGYAWNPVAFFDRPKDPDAPKLNLEGFILASASLIMNPAVLQRFYRLSGGFVKSPLSLLYCKGRFDHFMFCSF
jgi:hypothetical protein